MTIEELINGLKEVRETCIKHGVECTCCEYEDLCDVAFSGSAPAGWRLYTLDDKHDHN